PLSAVAHLAHRLGRRRDRPLRCGRLGDTRQRFYPNRLKAWTQWLLRGPLLGGVRLHLLPAAVRHLRRSASSSAILGYSGSGDDLLGVTDERCCQIGRSATSAMRGELQQRGRPVPAEPGRSEERRVGKGGGRRW